MQIPRFKILMFFMTFSQVFRSGILLLHQPSNSNYCVSLRQLAVPRPLWSGQQPAGQIIAAPGGYFYYQVYSGLVLQFLDQYCSIASKTIFCPG